MMSWWRLGYSSGGSSDWLCKRRWPRCILRARCSVVRRLSASTTGEEAGIPRELLVDWVGLEVLEKSLLEDGICASRKETKRHQKELKIGFVL